VAFEDPTQAEVDFYKALKQRFVDTKEFASPDVSDALATQDAPKLIAKHDCPAGSSVKKVEISFTFRLVHWKGEGAEGAGMTTLEKTDLESTAAVKKITYRYAVMFDVNALKAGEADNLFKWGNASLFYHEAMHLQATIDRIKAEKWNGWATACKCETPNPEYVGEGKKSSDEEHKTILPAQDEYLRKVIEAKEHVTVQIGRVTATAEAKDGAGKRPFKKTISVPEALLEKEGLSISVVWSAAIENDPRIDTSVKGKVVVEGKLKGDDDGMLLVTFDPPAEAFIVWLHVRARGTPNSLARGVTAVVTMLRRSFG
jgi:hypothetical protein